MKRDLLAQTALASSLLLIAGAQSAVAADAFPVLVPGNLPAVSGMNAKIDAALGVLTPPYASSGSAVRAQGALSFPLSHAYGFQADAAIASIQYQTFGHLAAHLFWRNPAQGLLGGYASFSTWGPFDRSRIAFEGEAYWGQFSFETLTGWETVTGSSGQVFTITDLAYYVNQNLRLSAGLRYNSAVTAVAGGLEYQFMSGPSGGLAAFVEGEAGSNNYQKLFAGLRLYLGADKSLERRHREDDPRIKADEGGLAMCYFGESMLDSMSDGSLIACDRILVAD